MKNLMMQSAETESLESVVRAFSFTPPLDVLAADDAVVIEIALPGVDLDAIEIERTDNALVVSGVRESNVSAERVFHAELPRGPFYRSIPLPIAIDHDPRVELDRGVLRIYLTEANRSNTSGDGHDEDGEQ